MSKPHRATSARQNWRTPPYLFHWAQAFGGREFALDAAADHKNALCPAYYTGVDPTQDGLKQPWLDATWCNPPFKRVSDFVDKAIFERVPCALLTTNATESKWFTRAVGASHDVVFITGRIGFIHPDTGKKVSGNTAGSTLFFMNYRLAHAFSGPSFRWVHRNEMVTQYEASLKVLNFQRALTRQHQGANHGQ